MAHARPASTTPPTGRICALRHTRAEYVRLALLAAVAVCAAVRRSTRTGSARQPHRAGGHRRRRAQHPGRVHRPDLPGHRGFLGVGRLHLGQPDYPLPTGRCRWRSSPPRWWPRPIGAFFGLPALRLKGLYLAIATLAAQEILVVRGSGRWDWLTGGQGILDVTASPELGDGPSWTASFEWYWVLLVIAGLVVWGCDQPVPHRARPVVHRHPRPGHRRRGDRRAGRAATRCSPSRSPAAWPASPGRCRPTTTEIVTWENFELDDVVHRSSP